MFPCAVDEKFETWFEPGSDFVVREQAFEQLLALARNESSPGLPLMYTRRLNRDVKLVPTELKALLEERIRKLLTLDRDIDEIEADYVDPAEGVRLVEFGFADPVRTFGKNEPQSVDKETRNISSVSLVDSMVDVILHWHQMQVEIDAVATGYQLKCHWPHPSTIGIDLDTPENLTHLLNRFRAEAEYEEGLGCKMCDSDLRGYEYCVGVGAHRLDQAWNTAMRRRAGRTEEWWWKLFRARNWVLMHPLLATSSGRLYTLAVAIMLSGSRRTAHKNSVIRGLLPTIVDMRHTGRCVRILTADVNGDDANESNGGKTREQIAAGYLELGFLMTDFNVQNLEKFEVHFCSYIHRSVAPRPEGYGKSVMKILAKSSLSVEEYRQFHLRYVVTNVVVFEEFFPLVAPVVATGVVAQLLAEGLLTAEQAAFAANCSTPAEQEIHQNQHGAQEERKRQQQAEEEEVPRKAQRRGHEEPSDGRSRLAQDSLAHDVDFG